jgi:hypothetical protein
MPERQAHSIYLASRLIAAALLAVSFLPSSSAAESFEPEAICRAAIATIAGRDPKAMQVTRIAGDVLFLSYVRPIDNFVWDYRCKIEGNRVFWASEPGRWREGPKDDKVSFEILGDGKQLRISDDHSDGSTTKELFDRDKIF